MAKKILWLDNDQAWTEPYADVLKDNGYEVTVVTTVSRAEELITTNRYDLLLLDVMIPTRTEAEEKSYPPAFTDFGLNTGLLFYKQMKDRLKAARISVLVLTVRLEQIIQKTFTEAGLPEDCFATKLALRDVNVFLDKVMVLLGEQEK